MGMRMKVKCSCGLLEAQGDLRSTQTSKRKIEHAIHYSEIVGSFYLHTRDDLIICSECNKPALSQGVE